MSRRNTRNLRPFIGKTISGIVETSQDEDEGRIQIQFTDGSAVEFQADSNSGSPWLNVDPVAMSSQLQQGARDPEAFAIKRKGPLPGFEQGARPPVQAFDDEWIGGSTEDGNPVRRRQIHPAITKMLDRDQEEDNKPFHPVDEVDLDELG